MQVPPASLVFLLWSPLTSLLSSDGSAPQLGTTVRINQLHVGQRDSYSRPNNGACNQRIIEHLVARKLYDRLMFQAGKFFEPQFLERYIYAIFFHTNNAPAKIVGP